MLFFDWFSQPHKQLKCTRIRNLISIEQFRLSVSITKKCCINGVSNLAETYTTITLRKEMHIYLDLLNMFGFNQLFFGRHRKYPKIIFFIFIAFTLKQALTMSFTVDLISIFFFIKKQFLRLALSDLCCTLLNNERLYHSRYKFPLYLYDSKN